MSDHAAEPLEAVLRRLKEERDSADARYNEALTAVDRSLRPAPIVPHPHRRLDDHQIATLNEAWNILPAPPRAAGLRQKLSGYVWGVVAPYLQRQLTFNSLLVDHINRSLERERDAHRTAEQTADALRDHLTALAEFQVRLLQYLQQITAYVDTKDRDAAGGALVLNAALSGLAETLAKHTESMGARERRSEARSAGLSGAHEELRSMVAVSQQALISLKREVERLQESTREGTASRSASPAAETSESGSPTPDHERRPANSGPPTTNPDAFAPSLDAYKYVGFEDRFRGSPERIRAKLESCLPLFDGRRDVLDVGCGRGEFLELLIARGIPARGIDLNHEMAESCRSRGLDVTEADAAGYLSSLPDNSLGGIFAAQVVEHLQPGYLLRFLELAFFKLRPGGRLVLETLNPACWVAFFDSYIRDITHVWPLHPDTLQYLVTASGFTRVTVEFRSPVPPEDRLQPIPGTDAMAEAFNGNVEKLNARLFTYLDYAVVGEKG